ncbi:hypothetical protein EYF80_023858 [Liparis tanakae]|uniref:Uncharacterized protein n=1 Tax=Liparis tanakae TaxID=230148 RepID=A0A4Z2HJ71_9TELE|nr:hypothetical protein EYF80_023858 [Liparis tanakae]
MGHYIEEAGLSIYAQIRDRLVEPGAAPLACEVFARDISNFEESLAVAIELRVLAPFARFLDLPKATYFEAGRFACLVPFLRGYFSIVEPQANALRISDTYRSERLTRFGAYWGQLFLVSLNTKTMKSLGVQEDSAEMVHTMGRPHAQATMLEEAEHRDKDDGAW